jgi:hypothetical protein
MASPLHGDDLAAAAVMYRRLAARVIELAFRDLQAPACAPGDRESARTFLAGSPILLHWCHVAAVDPRRVIARASEICRPLEP